MKNLLSRSAPKLALSFMALCAVLVSAFYAFEFIPSQRQLLMSSYAGRVKLAFGLSRDALSKAVNAQDDIGMLLQVEKIMKMEDAAAVYVLDGGQKVLMHNNAAEWNKIYEGSEAVKASRAGRALRQKVQGGYLFSEPLASSATLCVAVSSQKLDSALDKLRTKALITGALAFLGAAALAAWLVYYFFGRDISLLREGLKTAGPGGAKVYADGLGQEFSELREAVNRAISKAAENTRDGLENAAGGHKELIGAFAAVHDGGILFIDIENKIAGINAPAGDLFGIDPKTSCGKHILDVSPHPQLLELVKAASGKAGAAAVLEIGGKAVKAMAGPYGLIAVFK